MKKSGKVFLYFLYILSVCYLAYTLYSAISAYDMVISTYSGYNMSAPFSTIFTYVLSNAASPFFMTVALYTLALILEKAEVILFRLKPEEELQQKQEPEKVKQEETSADPDIQD